VLAKKVEFSFSITQKALPHEEVWGSESITALLLISTLDGEE
jgi:hypothetical protein